MCNYGALQKITPGLTPHSESGPAEEESHG